MSTKQRPPRSGGHGFHRDDKDDDRDDRGGDRHDHERPGGSDSDDDPPARAPRSNISPSFSRQYQERLDASRNDDFSLERSSAVTVAQSSARHNNFQSNLSAKGRSFAAIKVGDYDQCLRFITQNPEILAEDENKYFGEAISAIQKFQSGDSPEYPRSCIQQALILRKFKSMNDKRRKKFIQSLKRKDSDVLADFRADLSRVYAAIENTGTTSASQPSFSLLRGTELRPEKRSTITVRDSNRHSTPQANDRASYLSELDRHHSVGQYPPRVHGDTAVRVREDGPDFDSPQGEGHLSPRTYQRHAGSEHPPRIDRGTAIRGEADESDSHPPYGERHSSTYQYERHAGNEHRPRVDRGTAIRGEADESDSHPPYGERHSSIYQYERHAGSEHQPSVSRGTAVPDQEDNADSGSDPPPPYGKRNPSSRGYTLSNDRGIHHSSAVPRTIFLPQDSSGAQSGRLSRDHSASSVVLDRSRHVLAR